jgi:DNA polymerase I-like protein with 3'-5' exonuclease and polymerase domains
MKTPQVITIDFETFGIERRPKYPPVPVGVSIKWPGKNAKYFAWGHTAENNCSKEVGIFNLKQAYDSNYGLLFHNAKFDIDVAEEHLGMPRLDWSRYHDTQYLLFLVDPHADSFSLKPSAERLLDMPPEEQDAVASWLLQNQPLAGIKIMPGKQAEHNTGRYIAYAPGKLVGEYANGDVIRTEKLFKLLWPQVQQADMLTAYDIERELMPILLDNEKQGIRVDLDKLEEDFVYYQGALVTCDKWLRKRFKKPDLNIDSKAELAVALEESGVVRDWVLTPTGKKSVSKDNLKPEQFNDPRVANAMSYRSKLQTCLSTFMEPWLITARETNGIIHTNWNQVRQYSNDKKSKGTRTGRLSSSPNFQNIPKIFTDKGDGYIHPDHLKVKELPLMRTYLLPDKGGVFCHRDYNQQELRLAAHYEGGALAEEYRTNPRLDVHKFVGDEITRITGKTFERRAVKITNFGIIYGYGVDALAKDIGCSRDEANELKAAHRIALPGIRDVEQSIKSIGKAGEAIHTFGGREYYCEEPFHNGRFTMTFEYKLFNYLIQGSAADMTKRAVIAYNKMKKHGRFMVTVHDEINISVPVKHVKSEMKILKAAMESIKLDVPVVTDGGTGLNWGALEKYAD